jgi:PadR family transcriptional regulator AphA
MLHREGERRGSALTAPRLSTTEYAVLGILAEGRSHGFAISKHLDAGSEIGRVFTVRRPLVYRALDRLAEAGYAAPVSTERGDAGPQRVILRITARGRRRLHRWLAEPVEHVRDLRIEFLLKLTLLRRRSRSPIELIRAQRAALEPTLAALESIDPDDPVELWRTYTAAAAAAYLEALEQLHVRR